MLLNGELLGRRFIEATLFSEVLALCYCICDFYLYCNSLHVLGLVCYVQIDDHFCARMQTYSFLDDGFCMDLNALEANTI